MVKVIFCSIFYQTKLRCRFIWQQCSTWIGLVRNTHCVYSTLYTMYTRFQLFYCIKYELIAPIDLICHHISNLTLNSTNYCCFIFLARALVSISRETERKKQVVINTNEKKNNKIPAGFTTNWMPERRESNREKEKLEISCERKSIWWRWVDVMRTLLALFLYIYNTRWQ